MSSDVTATSSTNPKPAARTSLLGRIARTPSGALSLAWLGLMILIALFGRFIKPYDIDTTDVSNILSGPTGKHWMGTDDAGRDVFSRMLVATSNSLAAALICLFVAVAIGVVAGLIAGYFGGWFDQVSAWGTNLVMAMPGIVLLLAARSVLGPSTYVAMALFGVLLAPGFFRLVSGTVRGVKNELYVDAARVSGISDARIISRHVLRVVRGPIIIQAAIVVSISISVLAGLAFIGFSNPTNPTWGDVLSAGFAKIFRSAWLMFWPAITIALTTLSLAMLANGLRDQLEGGARNIRLKRPKPDQLVPDVDVGAAGEELAFGSPDEALRTAEATAELEAQYGSVGSSAANQPTIIHGEGRPKDALLTVEGLVVGYPTANGWVRVVRGVDLAVAKGEVLGLVGESGSGKTQTAFAVMGLLGVGGEILEGSVRFDGEEIASHSAREATRLRGRRIAYIPQEPMSNLDPSFTVGSQLVEPMRVTLNLSKSDAKAKALELLDKVGIPHPERVYKSYPHQLSGGMAQRVLIAGAVSSEPDLIIADEPTTALDVTVQAEILDLLRDLQAQMHTAVLLVTHNFGVVADLADRVSVMQHGRIVETGGVNDIFEHAEHPYTQSLLDAILDGAPARAPYEPKEQMA